MANQYTTVESSHSDQYYVEKMLSDPAPKFFDELNNGIKKSTGIGERWKIIHIANCRRLRTEMYNNHFDFIQKTKSNIEQAKLLANDDNGKAKRKELFESWHMLLSAITTRAKLFDRQLTALLTEICDQDKQFSTNYPFFGIAGLGSSLFGASLGAVVVAHYVPSCALLICGSAGAVACCPPLMAVLGVTLLVAGGFLVYRSYKRRAERATYERTRTLIKNWAVACCQPHSQLGVQDNCDDQSIEERIREGICQMKVYEETWYSNKKLDTFLNDIMASEKKLKEDQQRDEKTDEKATAPTKRCTVQ